MAPTIMFLKKQDYIGVDYEPGDTARVPHEVSKKMAAYWIDLGIARYVSESEIKAATAKVDAFKAEQARKAKVEQSSAAFAQTIEAPEEKPKRKVSRRK